MKFHESSRFFLNSILLKENRTNVANLNEEQLSPEESDKLVTDNVNLAYKLAHDWTFSLKDVEEEDIRQHALVGLTKAAKTYDPAMGTAFSTYAWRIITNYLNNVYRKEKKEVSNWAFRLDDPAYSKENDPEESESGGLHELISDPKSDNASEKAQKIETSRIVKEATKDLLNNLEGVHFLVMDNWLKGKSFREIAASLPEEDRISAQMVGNIVRAYLKELRSILKRKYHITSIGELIPESEELLREEFKKLFETMKS